MSTLTVPVALDSLSAIASFVLAAAADAGLNRHASYGLRLAVDELATNVIVHGHARGTIELKAELDEKTLTVVMEDEGVPFDPSQAAPPNDLHLPAEQRQLGGLGIHLVRKRVDSYCYARVGARNRNTLMMKRQQPLDHQSLQAELPAMPTVKGKIGVLIESHFDETEYHRFGEFFPPNGYAVEFLSHLWGQRELTFKGNDTQEEMTVSIEINNVSPTDYVAIMLIGGYAMDRLRYEDSVEPGRPNQAPAVVFLRKAVEAMDAGKLRIGAICHGLWLFCAAPELIKGRKVTCAHNILCDVQNAGGIPVYDGNRLKDTCIDRNLITGRHPGVIEEFMKAFLAELHRGR